MDTVWTTMPDGRVIGAPPIDEEGAACLLADAARRAAEHHEQWMAWGAQPYHFMLEGESVCNGEWAGGFPWAHKAPKKCLRCKECQRLNEKRKRLEKKAAD